jgi:hypothetical protein
MHPTCLHTVLQTHIMTVIDPATKSFTSDGIGSGGATMNAVLLVAEYLSATKG